MRKIKVNENNKSEKIFKIKLFLFIILNLFYLF